MRRFYLLLFGMLILNSCGSDEPKCSETRDLDIVPGEGIGPYLLGMEEEELVSILCSGYSSKLFPKDEVSYYFLNNMSFIFKKHRLREINVWGSFRGSYEDIGVDYDKDVLESYGEVVEHDGEFRILDIPKIAFGVEGSDEGKYIRIYQ